MTKQEMFDRAARQIRKQKGPSIKGGRCLYRGPNGAKCAAGVLISNKHYTPELEDKTADDPAVSQALRASGIRNTQISFVAELQEAHDEPGYLEYLPEWAERMRGVASKYRLSAKALGAL